MNEHKSITHQLRLVFREVYRVDPTARRRPVGRREEYEDTIPDAPVPR